MAGATLPPNPGELIESHAMETLHQTLSGAGAPLLGVIAIRCAEGRRRMAVCMAWFAPRSTFPMSSSRP
jgi:hypothetical protein